MSGQDLSVGARVYVVDGDWAGAYGICRELNVSIFDDEPWASIALENWSKEGKPVEVYVRHRMLCARGSDAELKYYVPVGSYSRSFAYAVRCGKYISVYEFDGSLRKDNGALTWDQRLIGAWQEVTEAAAKARLDIGRVEPKPLEEMVPAFEGPIEPLKKQDGIRYYIPCGHYADAFAYLVRTSLGDVATFEFDGSVRDVKGDSSLRVWSSWSDSAVTNGAWKEVPRDAALARVKKDVEPVVRYYIPVKSPRSFAYMVRTGDFVDIYERDGSFRPRPKPVAWDSNGDSRVETGYWKEATKEEALARVVKVVPVDLYVTYRVDSEGGDWPVRCARQGEAVGNWLKIQSDGRDGFFVEVPNGVR